MKEIDGKENSIWLEMPDVLDELLRDHTTRKNIFWATHDYEYLGNGYSYNDEILPERVTGEHGEVIKPRVLKSKELQIGRAKDMAEVFTPSWVCNAQNNLVDEAWFGRNYVKMTEVKRNTQWINKYKVIFSKATCEHAGTPDKTGRYKVFSTMKILKPNEICTQSYLVGGVFDSLEESANYLSYLKTCFVRFLMLQLLSTQDISADKFQFVPLQVFSKPWTDAELYAKYGLTENEIAFIESMIKPME